MPSYCSAAYIGISQALSRLRSSRRRPRAPRRRGGAARRGRGGAGGAGAAARAAAGARLGLQVAGVLLVRMDGEQRLAVALLHGGRVEQL
jgi:hypothetical protein